jgi:hypothetical protein
MRKLIILSFLTLLAIAGVAQPPDSTEVNKLVLKLQNPPQMPTYVSAARTLGNPSPRVLYYWVVTHNNNGASTPAGPGAAVSAPSSLSGAATITVSWANVAGAVSYDVLRTDSPTMPTGACNCAVATGVTTTTATDSSDTLQIYTLNTLDPATLDVPIRDENGKLALLGPSLALTGKEEFGTHRTPIAGVDLYIKNKTPCVMGTDAVEHCVEPARQPVDVGVTYNGKLAVSDGTNLFALVRHPFPFPVTIPQNCADATHHSKMIYKKTTITWAASLQKNGVEFGTAACASGTCTFTCASATSFAEGDVLEVTVTATDDTTNNSGIGGTIYGTRAGGVQ